MTKTSHVPPPPRATHTTTPALEPDADAQGIEVDITRLEEIAAHSLGHTLPSSDFPGEALKLIADMFKKLNRRQQ